MRTPRYDNNKINFVKGPTDGTPVMQWMTVDSEWIIVVWQFNGPLSNNVMNGRNWHNDCTIS